MRIVPIAGRDKYAGGHGRMLIKAASLVTVADAAGEPIDAGSMLRYLVEIIWFPSAAVGPYVRWEPIDAAHARATIRYAGKAAPAVFTFDENGRAVRFDAQRPLGAVGRLARGLLHQESPRPRTQPTYTTSSNVFSASFTGIGPVGSRSCATPSR